MEPISASCYNVNDETLTNLALAERQTNEKYFSILGSIASITKYEKRNFKTLLPQISAAIFATSFHVVLGISLAYSAILIPQLEENPEFPLTKTQASWVVSVIALTTPVGTIFAGFLMDKYGRLNTLRLAALPSVIGWVLIALSRNVSTLIIGRIFTSFASALGSGPAVVYITEIARVDMRGSLICFAPALASLGMVLTFLEGWFMDWRQVAWSCLVYTLLPLGLIYFLPESAVWLVSRNRNDEARNTLIWMNRYQPQPGDKTGTFADLQLALMQKEHELKMIRESKREGSSLGGFLKPTGYKPLLILSGLFCFQQFSGVFIFLFNSISFFQMIHRKIWAALGLIVCSLKLVRSVPPTFIPDYKAALKLSLLFYEAQRSGHLPNNNRINWRADSALTDHGQNNEDLTGGYYDASDFVKFSFTMAFTTTILAWGMLSFRSSYVEAGQYQEGLEAIKWATDYFIKCHTKPNEFYGQVGDFSLDHTFWGRPEEMNMTRPSYKIDEEHPGSDLAGEASAALSAASLLFKEVNETYSQELLRHAKELQEFATNFRGLYHEAIPGAKAYYESTGYADELTWATIWLYKATKDIKYMEQAESFYTKFRIKDRPNEFFYNKKVAGIQLLLAEQTSRTEYFSTIKSFCDYSIDDQTRTPSGLVFIEKFGTLSHAANIAFICLQAANLNISKSKYLDFAKQQLDYILGSTGRSFVVGYGRNYPKQPHHSASSCPDKPEPCGWKQFSSKGANPQILYGALVSGPDQNDHYDDVREEFLYNEVTLDYNAGFQSALAGLIHYTKKE